MTEPKWCPHCGAQHEGALALCEKCRAAGAVVAAALVPDKPQMLPAPGPFEARPKAKGSPARALTAVAGAVVLAGAAAAAIVWWPPSKVAPEAAAGLAPLRAPGEPAAAVGIAGEYWRETEPPGRPRKMSLCPDGRYFEYSAQVGRWSTPGGDEGKLALALDSGKVLELPFRILREPKYCSPAGCDAEFDGARYGRDPTLGNCP